DKNEITINLSIFSILGKENLNYTKTTNGVIYRSHYDSTLGVELYSNKELIISPLTNETSLPEIYIYSERLNWPKIVETELMWLTENKIVTGLSNSEITQISECSGSSTFIKSKISEKSIVLKKCNNWYSVDPNCFKENGERMCVPCGPPVFDVELPQGMIVGSKLQQERTQQKATYYSLVVVIIAVAVILILLICKKSFKKKTKIIFLVFLTFTLSLITNIHSVEAVKDNLSVLEEIKFVNITRWIDPEGKQPTPFNQTKDYKIISSKINALNIQPSLKILPVKTTLQNYEKNVRKGEITKPQLTLLPPSTKLIYLLVEDTIYNDIADYLNQYKTDVEKSGFTVEIYLCDACTPTEVRSLFQAGLSRGLVGALLVGDIPAAWYEIDNDFEEGRRAEFPIDLFYMDLDGIWTDSDGDGMYDNHTGNVTPEIWVGRLKASPLGDETSLLKNYFEKNHKYRNLTLSLPHRSLTYIDDDWASSAEYWNSQVGLVYNNTTLVNDNCMTTATDYKNMLKKDYEHILVAVHSSSGAHYFKDCDVKPFNDWVTSDDIKKIDPHGFFYNLFACSAARFTESNYIAGRYLFADTYGLVVVGSTKIGSMWYFDYFYKPLSEGKNFGEAFKEWFTNVGIYNKSWFYGMTLLGDPTLLPYIKDVSISQSDITYSPFIGRPVRINVKVHNSGDIQLDNITVRVYNGNPFLNGTQIGSDIIIPKINANETVTVSITWDNTPGSYDIYVVLDPDNSIIELDETNNIAYQTITIQNSLEPILLVDDDSGYNFEFYYKNALDNKGYKYNVWHVSALGNSPNITILSLYQIIIWFTGNDWWNTLTSEDQANLQTYLDSGGNLFISGQDIGWDLTENGAVSNSFYQNYLHAQYMFDDTNDDYVNGIAGDPISDGLTLNLSGRNNNYPSAIEPINGATRIFIYFNNGTTAGLKYNGTYKLIYLAFPFEAINNDSIQAELIDRSIKWLDSISPTWSNLKTSPISPVSYSPGQKYYFNISWTDTIKLDKVLLEFNNTNYTVITHSGSEFYYVFSDLPAGTYYYRWYASDASNNWNKTDLQTFVINKAVAAVSLFINGIESNITITYGPPTNVTAMLNITQPFYLYLNDTLINFGNSPLTNITVYGAGYYNFT
ncbi:MAG: CARDB domain-containing protein, partial [Thermoprotei archaeon]